MAYTRGTDLAEDQCCCGNHFAVGPHAAATLSPKPDFTREMQAFDSPWGEQLEAAWLVGPSAHSPSTGHGHDHESEHQAEAASTIDPVCGMTVQPEVALSRGLRTTYLGNDYYFCGKGCLLDFRDDPDKYLDPRHEPSM